MQPEEGNGLLRGDPRGINLSCVEGESQWERGDPRGWNLPCVEGESMGDSQAKASRCLMGPHYSQSWQEGEHTVRRNTMLV